MVDALKKPHVYLITILKMTLTEGKMQRDWSAAVVSYILLKWPADSKGYVQIVKQQNKYL